MFQVWMEVKVYEGTICWEATRVIYWQEDIAGKTEVVLCQGELTKEKEGVRAEIHVPFPNHKDIRKKTKRDFPVPHVFMHSAKTIVKLVFRTKKGENKPLVISRKKKKSCREKGKKFPVTESKGRRAIIVFQRQEIKRVAEKCAWPSGDACIRLRSAETKGGESQGRSSQKAVAGCKVEATVGGWGDNRGKWRAEE